MKNQTRTAMKAVRTPRPELRIRQKRGRVTYDALIDTAFTLLEQKEFDEISIAELAQKAGYSVGAFYARFHSKNELFDAMDCHDRRVPLLVLLGGIAGGLTGFGLQAWVSAVAYPLNIGGRPFISWPMFIPVTFELTILFAALTAVGSWIVLSGLPLPYHPVFNIARFRSQGSQTGFFLAIEAADAKFDRERTFEFLKGLGAREINEVAE